MATRRLAAVGLLVLAGLVFSVTAAGSVEPAYSFDHHIGDALQGEIVQHDVVVTDKIEDDESYRIRYTRWIPEEPNGQLVLYCHGLQDHRGWFHPTATRLQALGFEVWAFDRIGSGTSSEGLDIKKGEPLRLRGHVRDWRLFVETLDRMITLVGYETPGADIVLWSQGYGAKIVAAYLYLHPHRIGARGVQAAIFTAPWLFRNERTLPQPVTALTRLTHRELKLFPVPMAARDDDNGAAWFVGPGRWFETIRSDELSLREVTTRFYLETREMEQFVDGRPGRTKLGLPVFVLLAEDDPVADNERGLKEIRAHATDAVYKTYPAAAGRHFLMLSDAADEALSDVVFFLGGKSDEIVGLEQAQ